MTQVLGDGGFGSPERQRIFRYAVLALASIFVLRLGWLQIVQGGAYRLKAEAQAIKQIKIEPFRGIVYDRKGRAIVRNAPGFSIAITPYQFTEESCIRLSAILGVPDSLIWQEVHKAAAYNKFNPAKISYGRDIDFAVMSAIEEQRDELIGVDVIIDPKRYYAFEGNATHLLGYTREVSEWQLKQLGDSYDPGDITGYSGLESSYETYIRGQKGLQFVAVNNRGQRVASFNEGKSDQPPGEGFDLYLGLDVDVQVLAEKLMEGKRGGAVAIDPSNGEVIAFVSKPDFDLRKMTGRASRSFFNSVMTDPEKPQFNRASMPTYPPGSTWKMLIALACLQEGLITPTTTLYCGGSYNYGNKSMACHGAHGGVQLARAIQASCNVYFAQCGMKLGSNGMKKYASMFGFGEKAGMDIPSGEDARGRVPDSTYMDKIWGKRGWSPYAPANWGIGQGEVTVTPLQMARYTAAIANGGTLYQPHAVRAMYNKILRQKNDISFGATEIPIDKTYIDAVKKGMFMVVNEPGGTAFSVKIPDITMCGKTGTAQNPHGKDHSWFVCYAPADDPKIAICVMVENAGFGSTVAAPIAKQMVELYLKGRWPEEFRPKSQIAQIDSAAAKTDTMKVDTTKKKKSEQPVQKGPFVISAVTR